MLGMILIVSLAFVWLGYETEWLRIRLIYGARAPQNEQPKRQWQFLKYGDDALMLCQNCNLSSQLHSWRTCKKSESRWTAWRLPAKTITAFGYTINLQAGCNICRANFLRDVVKAQTAKVKPSQPPKQPPLFIEQVTVGSHREWIETTPKHGYHTTVVDTKTVYHDCLAPKSWLKEHEHDNYPEPTMELIVDGKATANINGDYKRGMIKDALKPYTTKAKIGRKVFNIPIGEADRVVK